MSKTPNGMKYGPDIKTTRFNAGLSLPLVDLAKKVSDYPIIKWLLNPFWSPRYNEVTAIPINIEVNQPDNVSVPRRLLERLINEVENIFIMDTCFCREVMKYNLEHKDIGCMALGPSVKKIHPSHGHLVKDKKEAIEHVRKAAKAGLVADMAWTWVDPFTFGSKPLNAQLFFCFCDDRCFYRGNMRKRGPNLNKVYKKLPGVSISIDAHKCKGCGTCVENCFAGEMKLMHNVAVPGPDCKACGKCAEFCPNGAVTVILEDEEILFRTMMDRIAARTKITSR